MDAAHGLRHGLSQTIWFRKSICFHSHVRDRSLSTPLLPNKSYAFYKPHSFLVSADETTLDSYLEQPNVFLIHARDVRLDPSDEEEVTLLPGATKAAISLDSKLASDAVQQLMEVFTPLSSKTFHFFND